MARFEVRITRDLKLDAQCAQHLATTIRREVQALPEQDRKLLYVQEGVTVRDRLDELIAFQGFMDLVHSLPTDSRLIRAQVLAQNYVCFVYLGESCFMTLRRVSPAGSAIRRCSEFLTQNPVRAFRNAVAHALWRYRDDFSGLEFWARKGSDRDEPTIRWEVSQEDLMFWQAIARCTAYATFLGG